MRFQLYLPVALTVALLPSTASATNGMDPISFGARAAGMAGTDTAVATDTNAMNTNPAGITQFEHGADLGVSLMMPKLTLNDQVTTPQGTMLLNQGLKGESKVFPLISAGYAQRVYEGLHVGLGFYVQGGMGAEFKNVHTFVDNDPTTPLTTQPTPATYDMSSQVSYFKLVPTVAYRLENIAPGTDLSFGVAFNVGLSSMKFSHSGFQFPEPDNDGVYQAHKVEFNSDNAMGYGVRAGVLASFLQRRLAVGVSYQSKASLDYKGPLKVDSMMEYDAKAGFGWPQELAFGVSARPVPRLLLAVETRWINWADTMDTVTFSGAAKGAVPPGYESMTMPFQMKWKNQLVFSAGAEVQVLPDLLKVRAGYNHANSPVTGDGINPLFPAVTQDHLAAGLGVTLVKGLTIDGAAEFALNHEVTSNAANQMAQQPGTGSPNGYQFGVAMSQTTVHLGVGYQF